MNKKKNTVRLIKAYLVQANVFYTLLKQVNSDGIESQKEGDLFSELGLKYCLHGSGCSINLENEVLIDFEIGQSHPILFFDSWKFWEWLGGERYSDFQELETLLLSLVSEKILKMDEELFILQV